MKKAIRAAFPYTLPILFGYGFMGIAFGILLNKSGYGFIWATLIGLLIFSGSMQFVAIGILTTTYDPIACVILTITVNCRYMFYGISLLDLFKPYKLLKFYMIHAITDETYSILCSVKPNKDINAKYFRIAIAVINHIYWVIGCTIGGILGSLIDFNTRGIEFTMTALFIVIAVEQFKSVNKHLPALIGLVIPIICLIIFGTKFFVIMSMLFIIITLLIFKEKIEKGRVIDETIF